MVQRNWLNLISRLVIGYLKGNKMRLIGLSESKQNWITHKANLTFKLYASKWYKQKNVLLQTYVAKSGFSNLACGLHIFKNK